MMPEKWVSVIGNIKDNFKVKNQGTFHVDDEGGVDIEYIEFDGPLGLMRLEFITKPVILDKKTIYSNRIGSETKIDYVYSDSEKSHMLVVYKWESDQEDWIEMENNLFN